MKTLSVSPLTNVVLAHDGRAKTPSSAGERIDDLPVATTGNPFIPGYFADPTHIEYEGVNYLYVTLDPWGDRTLGCWSGLGFRDWRYHTLNWPTKDACTSAKSHANMVWAPAVMRAPDGAFYMYVSVGSEIWVGKAAHPLGPWHNALGERPLIEADYRPGFHMIDAEAFVDDDGAAYLYWGSGWNWTNGRCWAVRLGPDYVSFAGEPIDVTPANYFEAPCMVKKDGRYYLMYSQGKTTEDTYQVHYAVGDSPLGPFHEAANSPILTTDHAAHILSPGHHTVITRDGNHYILYHRHTIPMDSVSTKRQLCLDAMVFRPDGLIETVKPTHEGPFWLRTRRSGGGNLAHPSSGASICASSEQGPRLAASCAVDQDYTTRWSPEPEDETPWIRIDLGCAREIRRIELRFEYPWKKYSFICECSLDGIAWEILADQIRRPLAGSPVVIEAAASARFLRISFRRTADVEPSLIEWVVE
jgi:hypothetical protein